MNLLSTATRLSASLLAAAFLTGGALPVQAGTPTTDTTVGSPTKTPVLSGTVSNVQYKANTVGIKVKAAGTLSNTGTKGAKSVTATAYLSSDNKFDSTDTKIVTVSLSSYNTTGTLAKATTLPIVFKRSFPTAIAKGLTGKYIIVILAATNVDPSTVTPIVVGPLTAP